MVLLKIQDDISALRAFPQLPLQSTMHPIDSEEVQMQMFMEDSDSDLFLK